MYSPRKRPDGTLTVTDNGWDRLCATGMTQEDASRFVNKTCALLNVENIDITCGALTYRLPLVHECPECSKSLALAGFTTNVLAAAYKGPCGHDLLVEVPNGLA